VENTRIRMGLREAILSKAFEDMSLWSRDG
jgi:hypothetical protein